MLTTLFLAIGLSLAPGTVASLASQVPAASRPAVEAGLAAWRHAMEKGAVRRPEGISKTKSRGSVEGRE